jgi:hypothetical protein
MLRKIPSLFVGIKDHPVFSADYLNELLTECVTEHSRVEEDGATCLTPVKTFFREAFQVNGQEVNFLFDLLPLLQSAELLKGTGGCNLEAGVGEMFYLPTYSFNEINERIRQVRLEFSK